jgi:hypothetical protein
MAERYKDQSNRRRVAWVRNTGENRLISVSTANMTCPKGIRRASVLLTDVINSERNEANVHRTSPMVMAEGAIVRRDFRTNVKQAKSKTTSDRTVRRNHLLVS